MAVPTYEVYLYNDDTSTVVNISQYVRSVSISRGRSRELERFDAGTFSITLDNRTRYFDPKYVSSPFADYLTTRRYLEVFSNSEQIYSGYVRDWNFSYDISGESIANVTGTDYFSFLAQISLTAGVQTSELTGTRLSRFFDFPGSGGIVYPPWVPLANIEPGKRTLQADTIVAGTNALEYFQDIEKTEGGYFFIDQRGQVTFLQSRAFGDAGLIFTDAGTSGAYDIAYQNIEIVYGSELLYNDVTLTRLNGSATNVIKQSSIDRFGVISYADDNYLHANQADTAKQALLLAAKYSEPEYRFDSISVLLNPLSYQKQVYILQAELANTVSVIFTPNKVGDPITKNVRIIGIEHQINPDSHIVTFRFQSQENEQFILNDTNFGSINWNVLGF